MIEDEHMFEYHWAAMVSWQGSLFSGSGGVETLSLERSQLGRGAWVDICYNWMPRADALFDELLRAVPWGSERRPMYERVVEVPRLLAHYGEDDALPADALQQAKLALIDHYREESGGPFSSTGLCLYRDGRDSVAWHGDQIGRNAGDVAVAIISLGAPRRLLLRAKGSRASECYRLGGGDLFVMGGSCQRTWEHSVPKAAHAGPRISIQFRPRGL